MVRRYILLKLKPEHQEGSAVIKLLKTAQEVLMAAFGVQGIYAAKAADADTEQSWNICLTIEYVSGVDLQRSMKDPITRSFVKNFLEPRCEKVEMLSFQGETPKRL